MRHVFLSHAQRDKFRPDQRLRSLARFFLAADIPMWIDKPDELGLDTKTMSDRFISIDGQWTTDIRYALRDCHAGVGVWSRHSAARLADDPSGILFQELSHLSLSDRLFLINLDAGGLAKLNSLGAFAHNQQCIDLTISDKRTFALRVSNLCETLRERTGALVTRAPLLKDLVEASAEHRPNSFSPEIIGLYKAFEAEDAGAMAPMLCADLAFALQRHISACRDRNLPMRTFHRLLAAMQTPSRFVRRAFDSHEAGLGERIEAWLMRQIANQGTRDTGAFARQELVLDATYQRALALAEIEHAADIDERHFFLAIAADPTSGTITQIIKATGADGWSTIERIAHSTRPEEPEVAPTTDLEPF